VTLKLFVSSTVLVLDRTLLFLQLAGCHKRQYTIVTVVGFSCLGFFVDHGCVSFVVILR